MERDGQRKTERLGTLLRSMRRGVAFTGAGLSTGSGIPDFRSPGGLWARHRPIDFGSFLSSAEQRREAWRRKFAIDDATNGAAPNAAHRAVACLVEQGRIATVVTQNIDGLHQASGVTGEKLIELHGNGTYATCLDCGARHELAEIRPGFEATGEPPACRICGGFVKSAMISFGQQMPAEAMRRAQDAAREADVFLVLGSSLVV
ncbi:MAG TPA: Sir2 family NAD-dependent protein deacetylase, partial [Hansschlegelia sp.]